MEKLNILFLGGAKRLSLAERFIKAGNRLDLQINLFSYELDENVPIIDNAKVICGLKWTDNNIISHLIDTITKYSIKIVLPFVDPAISILARLKELYQDVFVPVSSERICKIMFDKIFANEWFLKYDFPVPVYNDKLPLIAKPRSGSASEGIQIIKNDKDFEHFTENFNKDNFILQEFIDADEYTVDAYVCNNGKIMGIVPRRRIEVSNGEVTKAITEKNGRIINLSDRILKTGDFRGPITIQFLKDRKNQNIFVMEVNPRFGGGVINSIEAGFDIPLLLLQDYFEIENEPINDWQENLLMMRAHREVFICK